MTYTKAKQDARDAYVAKHCAMTRPELLHLCRAGGISANRIKHNYHLAMVLWENFGARAFDAEVTTKLQAAGYSSLCARDGLIVMADADGHPSNSMLQSSANAYRQAIGLPVLTVGA